MAILDAECPRGDRRRTAAEVMRCDVCAGGHQIRLRGAHCTAAQVQSWCAQGALTNSSRSDYSLPYTVYYNLGAPFYNPSGGAYTYPSPSPRTFGFVADNGMELQETVGTNTFDFSGDPAWPNFIRNGDNYSWTPSCPKPGVRTETPLGPQCCAPGGCLAQHGNVSAVIEMTRKHVLSRVSPSLQGNCVIDFEV